MTRWVPWVLAPFFVLCGCAPNFSAARHQARLDHHCEDSEAVWWDRAEGGVWVRVCGIFRYYEGGGGAWEEDPGRAYRAEMGNFPSSAGGCPIYDGLVQCGGGEQHDRAEGIVDAPD